MILWYFNIDDFPVDQITPTLSFFPKDIEDEINRFRLINDKKSRLVARLLLQKYVLETRNKWNWNNWRKDKNHKPTIGDGLFFNISHSGNIVIIGFSEKGEIGVDIEEMKDIDVVSLVNYFHKDEMDYLKQRSYSNELFYTIWTKKEAFLKANGIGIVNGVHQVSVIEDQVYYSKKWNIKSVELASNYKCAVCSEDELHNLKIEQIKYETLNKFINEKILF